MFEVVVLCAAAMVLVFAAVFVSSGGVATFSRFMALHGIYHNSQTASTIILTVNRWDSTPTAVAYGSASTLNWNVTNVDQCIFSGGMYGDVVSANDQYNTTATYPGVSCSVDLLGHYNCSQYIVFTGVGGISSGALTQPTTFYISCNNFGGSNSGQVGPVAVTVPIAAATTISNFSASPAVIPQNTATTLSWSGAQGTYFTGCTLSGGQWSGAAVSINGSSGTNNLSANTSYTLTCNDSAYGPTTRTITVSASSPVVADATPSTITISAGQSATLSYFADSAIPPTQCQVNNYNDTLALANVAGCSSAQARTFNTGPLSVPGTYSYKFYYYQTSWVLIKTITVTVLPSCTFSPVTVNVPVSGNTATLTYTTLGATSATVNNGASAPAVSVGVVKGPFYVTSGATWSVPADWNSTNNTVEVIGGGAGGTNGSAGTGGVAAHYVAGNGFYGGAGGTGGSGGTGGGGGAYSYQANVTLTPSTAVTINVGGGGGTGGSGGDTFFNGGSCVGASVCAKGGVAGGTGGSSASGIGTTRYSGGNGVGGSGGAGGAAGGFGSSLNGPTTASGGAGGYSGGGGGAAGKFGAGAVASTKTGGTGDAAHTAAGTNGTEYSSSFGSGGGANGNNGAAGGAGGPGTSANTGNPGSPGGSGIAGGSSGSYGAGGAGGSGGGGGGGGGEGFLTDGAGGAGGGAGIGSAGKQGLIVINYTTVPGSKTVTTPGITASPTTFTMTVNDSVSGLTGSCSIPVTLTDVCTDISGFQSVAPASPCVTPTPSPGQCVPYAYTWNGTSCVNAAPTISSLVITPHLTGAVSAVRRVRKGGTVSLDWSLNGLVASPSTSCSVSSNPPSAMTTINWDQVTVPWNQGVTSPTATITGTTIFTVSCTNSAWIPSTISASASVGLVPVYQDL